MAPFPQPGTEDTLRFELRHQAIIARLGRYPHRNAILGLARHAARADFPKRAGLLVLILAVG